MIRVGTAEVYVKPDGDVQPAFLAVVWGVNRECKALDIDPIFGEPKLESDSFRSWEHYPEADVVHIVGEAARKADPTIRIVPKSDRAVEIFDKVWAEIRPRTALIRYAHNIPGVNLEKLENYRYLETQNA